jgi:hypothetical protein
MDDILVFSKTPVEHIQHLTKVFQKLREHQLYLKLKKCDFFKKELQFLGHIITSEGIKPDPRKVKVVQDMSVPEDQSALRRFLGLTNYFRKYIRDYARITVPLTDLIEGNLSKRQTSKVKINWSPEGLVAFDSLKYSLVTAPVLTLPDFTKPFEVIADASDFALGAILIQEGKPIAYESRSFPQPK